MKMPRWIHGIRLKDHIKSVEIRKRAKVKPIVAHVINRRLSWYGHIRRRDAGDITIMVRDKAITLKETHRQAQHQMDGQYQEIYENIWPRRPNDGRQEGVVKDWTTLDTRLCTRPNVRRR